MNSRTHIIYNVGRVSSGALYTKAIIKIKNRMPVTAYGVLVFVCFFKQKRPTL